MFEEESRESKKNISDKFLEIILSSLQNLQDFETSMRRGCENIVEYILQQHNFHFQNRSDLNYVQVENMNFMINEFELLLPNIKSIVKDTDMKEMEKKFTNIKNLLYKGLYSEKKKETYIAYKEIYNQVSKTKTIKIYPLFNIISQELSSLRGNVVMSLNHILFIQSKSESESEVED